MKRQILFLAIALVIFIHGTYAGAVSVSDAQTVALNFYSVNTNVGAAPTATLVYTMPSGSATAAFYVFDMSPDRGFVIVAGDDRVKPILAYSTESNFKTGFKNTGVNDWAKQTAGHVSYAVQHNISPTAQTQALWAAYRQGRNPYPQRGGSAGPLCATTWDQENDITYPPPYIYNLFCPFIAADTERCLTGCVATAMGQVMKYWNYPVQGTGSYTYVDDTTLGYQENIGTLTSDFAAHSYQWDSMPTVLTDATTGAQDSSVDQLLYDCAISVGMDFGDDNVDGSSANSLLANELADYGDSICTQTALIWYFGYDLDSISGIFRTDPNTNATIYTDSAWIAVLEHEINVGRPFVYEGVDTTPNGGGHAWVCDGYQSQASGLDYLHMNWGWGGYANGFFSVDDLLTGAPVDSFNPVSYNDALIGIVPKRSATGINKLSDELSVKIFPNPASSQVILQTSEAMSGATWELRNIVDQTVLNGSLQGLQTLVNVSGLASGLYTVEIRTGSGSVVKKLVISRR